MDAQNVLSYGESMVSKWLAMWMFTGLPNAQILADSAARHFNDAQTHMSHGRRIDRDEARSQNLTVEDLEGSSLSEEEVLTVYHVMTIGFEQTFSPVKTIRSSAGRAWVKNQ